MFVSVAAHACVSRGDLYDTSFKWSLSFNQQMLMSLHPLGLVVAIQYSYGSLLVTYKFRSQEYT